MASHAKLSEDQRERLEMLAEEAAEVVQACTKILRHGYMNFHPNDPDTSNRNNLEREIMDLCAVVREMDICGDIEFLFRTHDFDVVWKQKLRYTHHQE